MLDKLYIGWGAFLILLLTYAHFIGWSTLPHFVAHNVPKTVRDNPGSYRSIYVIHTHYSGGK